MGFVPGFEHDIFISYSHIDNLPKEGKQWVDSLHKDLEVMLWQAEGRRQIKIWRDLELEGNQKFDEVLQSRLERSAILVCLNSPAYLHSDYCSKERNWFLKTHANRLQVGDRSRIFNVLLRNIPPSDWPVPFQGSSGFPFYEEDRDYSFPARPGSAFDERLRPLVEILFRTLTEMQRSGVKPPGSTQPAAVAPRDQKRLRLFFGQVSDSLASRKKRLISELSGDGFEVLDPAPPPETNPEHDTVVNQRVSSADLSIHLLDELPGREIGGESKGYIQRQLEVAQTTSTPQLVWVPKELKLDEDQSLEPEEKSYRAFIQSVEAAARGKTNYDFVRGERSQILQEIRDRLDNFKTTRQPPPQDRSVLLDVHIKDQPYVLDVYRYLAQNGMQPLLNPEGDDPRANESLFVEQLRRVSALIIFFGGVTPEWVVERLFAAAKLKVIERCPVRAFGVYVAPPRKPDGAIPSDWGPWMVYPMDNTGGFDPATLAPLLADLAKPAPGIRRG